MWMSCTPDIMWGPKHFTSVLFFPNTCNPCLNHEKNIRQVQIGDILWNSGPYPQGNWRCQNKERLTGEMRHLHIMCSPGLDRSLDKIFLFVSPFTLPSLTCFFSQQGIRDREGVSENHWPRYQCILPTGSCSASFEVWRGHTTFLANEMWAEVRSASSREKL